MQRRHFLAAGLCAPQLLSNWMSSGTAMTRVWQDGESSGVQEAAAPAKVGKARKIKKALKWGMIQMDLSVADKFQMLADLGFDGVEIDSPSKLDLDEVLAASQKTGVLVPGVVDSVHWQQTLSHPKPEVRAEGRAALRTALRDAKKVGASSVLLVPAVVNEGATYEQAWERSIPEIQKLLPLAEELEVQIAFENVWNGFITEPKEAARYVDAFNSPWVGWYFDVGNAVRYGAPAEWVPVLGKRILKLDIKEYSNELRAKDGLGAGFKAELLEGSCDWPTVMAELDKLGYEGWATAEVRGGDRTRLADLAARMDRIFAS